jgi:hypothetical protein
MLRAESPEISQYLKTCEAVDFENPLVLQEINLLGVQGLDENGLVKKVFEHVRDTYPHSFDLLERLKPTGPTGSAAGQISCSASDVIRNGHGACYAKSHLLAAILRRLGIPTGFCYQKLIFSVEAPKLVLHAVNAVYLSGIGKWVRLDARGNKPGVDAQFSTGREKLAFPVRPELGEQDGDTIYAKPSGSVIAVLKSCKTLYELADNLPENI